MQSAIRAALLVSSASGPAPFPFPPGLRPAYVLPPYSGDRTLPFVPPTKPDLLFYRGDFCGPEVPGIPILPSMSGYTVPPWNENRIGGPNPPIMALDIEHYYALGMMLEVRACLITHQILGHTHLQCDIGTAMQYGMGPDQFVAYCQLVGSYGFFRDVWFMGGGSLTYRDMDRTFWGPIFDPWVKALLAAKAIDCACVGWQLDGYNTGVERMIDGRMQSPIQSIIDYFAEWFAPRGIPLGTHWLNEAGAWNVPFNRFVWWQDQHGKLTWFHHQGDTSTPIPDYQSKLVDTLNPFGDGRMGRSGLFGDRPYSLNVFECNAQARFDLNMTLLQGAIRGFGLTCTNGASFVGGYGNDGYRESGMYL